APGNDCQIAGGRRACIEGSCKETAHKGKASNFHRHVPSVVRRVVPDVAVMDHASLIVSRGQYCSRPTMQKYYPVFTGEESGRNVRISHSCAFQTRSSATAIPCPTPMHIVARAYLPPLSESSSAAV